MINITQDKIQTHMNSVNQYLPGNNGILTTSLQTQTICWMG